MQKFIKHGCKSVQIVKLGIMVNIFTKSAFFLKAGNETNYFIIWNFSWYLFSFLDPVSIHFDTEVSNVYWTDLPKGAWTTSLAFYGSALYTYKYGTV